MPDYTAGAILLTFHQLSGPQIEELTPLCLDLAAATDVDDQRAALFVGRSTVGRPTSLRRLGFTMSDHYEDDPYTATVTALRERVEGYREAFGDTDA